MPQLLERRWELGVVVCYDSPLSPALASTSLFWYCFQCGNRYAELRCWIDNHPSVWQGISGCCPACPGSNFHIPGTIEALKLVGWQVPDRVLAYQLDCELRFYDSLNHIRNSANAS